MSESKENNHEMYAAFIVEVKSLALFQDKTALIHQEGDCLKIAVTFAFRRSITDGKIQLRSILGRFGLLDQYDATNFTNKIELPLEVDGIKRIEYIFSKEQA